MSMTRKALISTAELTRLAKLAKTESVTVEIEKDGVIIRVMPFREEGNEIPPTTSLEEWGEWNEARKSKSQKDNSRGVDRRRGGTSDPPQEWYDGLGFDPKTMDRSELPRLRKEAHAKWKASIPGTKLIKRELSALKQLCELGVGVRVPQIQIKGCGDDTLDRLDARGYVGREQTLTEEQVSAGRSLEVIWLLDAGLGAYRSENR